MTPALKTKVPTSVFNLKNELLNPLSSIFDDMFYSNFPEFGKEVGLNIFDRGSYPKCDVTEYNDKVNMQFEIPGLEKDDIVIETKKEGLNTVLLTVSGKRESFNSKNEGKVILKELKHSRFQRSFYLDSNKMDVDSIDAKFELGILNINIPKREVTEIDKTNKITIK